MISGGCSPCTQSVLVSSKPSHLAPCCNVTFWCLTVTSLSVQTITCRAFPWSKHNTWTHTHTRWARLYCSFGYWVLSRHATHTSLNVNLFATVWKTVAINWGLKTKDASDVDKIISFIFQNICFVSTEGMGNVRFGFFKLAFYENNAPMYVQKNISCRLNLGVMWNFPLGFDF